MVEASSVLQYFYVNFNLMICIAGMGIAEVVGVKKSRVLAGVLLMVVYLLLNGRYYFYSLLVEIDLPGLLNFDIFLQGVLVGAYSLFNLWKILRDRSADLPLRKEHVNIDRGN